MVSCCKLDEILQDTREAVMNSSGSLGRSVRAVIAGIMVGFVLTVITDVVLHALGVFPPWGQPVGEASSAGYVVSDYLWNCERLCCGAACS